MKYLLMLMLHSDITLVTSVSMLIKPNTTQTTSDNGHWRVRRDTTVSGMLTMDTSKSAADNPRMNIFVVVRSAMVVTMIIHIEILPTTAVIIITHKTNASMTSVASDDSSNAGAVSLVFVSPATNIVMCSWSSERTF